MTGPKNDFEAVVLALKLAVTAPDDERADECVKIVEGFGLSEFEIERAKKEALRQIEEGRVSGHIVIDYDKKIPPVFEIEGVSYPPPVFDPDECTLKDQIVDLLDTADQHYAEFFAGEVEDDYVFPLIDAVKILQAAIERIDTDDGK